MRWTRAQHVRELAVAMATADGFAPYDTVVATPGEPAKVAGQSVIFTIAPDHLFTLYEPRAAVCIDFLARMGHLDVLPE